MAFGTTPVSTTSFLANQFPVSAVAVPGASGGNLTALEGGPATTDANGNALAPAATYVYDGNNVTQGATSDSAVTGDNPGTISAKLRGLNKIYTDIWDAVNHRIKVDGSGVTQPVWGAPSSTSALTSVAASVSNTSLLTSNTSRKTFFVFNDSAATMYLAWGATASTSSYTVQVPPTTLYEMPSASTWQGAVSAVWSSATGNARVTEIS